MAEVAGLGARDHSASCASIIEIDNVVVKGMAEHRTFRCIRATNGKVNLVYTSLAECLQTDPDNNHINVDVLVRRHAGDTDTDRSTYRIICRRVHVCARKHYDDYPIGGIRCRVLSYIRGGQLYYENVTIIKYIDDQFQHPVDVALDDSVLLLFRRYFSDELAARVQ